jgi:hypothetical protein
MKKKRLVHSFKSTLVLAFCCTFFLEGLIAQIGYEFRMDKPYELDYFDRVVCDADGNIYCTYHRVPQSASVNDYFSSVLYKIFPNGDTVSFTYEKQDTALYYSVSHINENGEMILEGNSFTVDSAGNQVNKFQIYIKLNSDLSILWERMYHLESDSIRMWAFETVELMDGKLLSVGSLQNLNSSELYMRAFVMSDNGDSIDYKVFETEQYGLISSILLDSLYNTIDFHMERASTIGGESDAKRMKLDTNLDFISMAPYPSDNFDGPFYTLPFEENNILSGGYYYDSQEEKQFLSAIVMDQYLNLVDEVVLCDGEKETYPAWIKCIDYHNADQVFIAGMYDYSDIHYDLPNWIYLAQLDQSLDLVYEEYWGGDAFYCIFSICATPDGGVVLAGYAYDHNSFSYQYDGFVIKFDSAFFVGINSPISSDNCNQEIEVRASNEGIYIESGFNNAEFLIYDLSGKCILTSGIKTRKKHLNVNLKPGIYIWRINEEQDFYSGKIHIN